LLLVCIEFEVNELLAILRAYENAWSELAV